MEPAPDESSPAIVAAFLERFLEDRRRGEVRALRSYQDEFPEHHGLIAHEYGRLTHPDFADGGGIAADTELGPYRIRSELGRGGQAVVYLARDTRLDRDVAIKVLTHPVGITPQRLARFHREAEVASKLDHKNICSVYDTGHHGRTPYIVMRYIAGDTLREMIAQARGRAPLGDNTSTCVTLPDVSDSVTSSSDTRTSSVRAGRRTDVMHVVKMGETVARALHAAHESGIIHRDVKPGNLMVTPDGDPVIMDFGLARLDTGDGSGLTLTGEAFGTPAYMSPEQIQSDANRVDARSDVYALATTLYEALTLRRPFPAREREALFRSILTEDPPDPRNLNSAIPVDLSVVLQRALEKKPERRYASSLDLAEDLRRVRQYEPILARPVGPMMRTWGWAQLNRLAAGALLGIFFALSAGLAVSLSALSRVRQEKEVAQRRADDLLLRSLPDKMDELWPLMPETVTRPGGIDDSVVLFEETLDRLRGYAEKDGDERWRAGIEELEGSIGGLKARRRIAVEMVRRTVDDHREDWDDVIEAVADREAYPQYGGMALRAIPGLLPLGENPETGYFEFAHLPSGPPAVRDPVTGEILLGDHGIVLVLLPGGTFDMGSPASEPGHASNETLHRATVRPFLIGKFELTQRQWTRVMGENPSEFSPLRHRDIGFNHPVECVSWNDAAEYCRRMELELPTEAQWEYACRNAGQARHRYAWGDDEQCLNGRANIADQSSSADSKTNKAPWDDGFPRHAPAGTFCPNGAGLFDMHGNVCEWVGDLYRPDYLKTAPIRRRVFRGGSYYLPPRYSRAAMRHAARAAIIVPHLGLRCGLTIRGD